jgi:hypothetical protein
MAAQTEPALVTVNMPKYPPLARQARIEGVVKLTFTLSANAGEPKAKTYKQFPAEKSEFRQQCRFPVVFGRWPIQPASFAIVCEIACYIN